MMFFSQISFHAIPRSLAAEMRIRRRVDKLSRFYKRIISCRVVVEPLIQRHRRGNLYHVRVDLRVPGKEIIVGGTPTEKHASNDLNVAIRNTFDTVERKLQQHVRQFPQQRSYGRVVHQEGRVIQLLQEGNLGYGFLRTKEGREVYFHEKSVLNQKFKDLTIGSKVRFHEEEGEEGPQASTVVLDPHGFHS